MSLPPTVLPTGLQLIQYGLPVLLGYTLYVGVAGRLAPTRPASVPARPAWLLGLWVGASVAAIVGTAMHLAHGLPLERAPALLRATAWSLGAALSAGGLAWLAYRRSVRGATDANADADADADADAAAYASMDATTARAPAGSDDPFGLVAADVADLPYAAVAGGDTTGAGPAYEVDETDEADAVAPAAPAPVAGAVPDGRDADVDTRRALEDERRLREQTEKHLQVTRRALYSLDATAREGEDARADALIALETELEAHVRRSGAAEARATREECGRVRAETNASELKREVLRLRSELRRTAEARARAVATAGKSVAFARRALQARAALEERLRETGEALANRQETISSLIRALEVEKGRTEAEVASRAKQLVLHERQLRERRSLEEVARSVEGRLSTRLVKKVARARPLAGT